MELLRVLKQPIISEKSFSMAEDGKYVFMVNPGATKTEISQAVEKAFKVHVISVNTIIVKGKTKRFGKIFGKRSDYKKAIVTIKSGETIEDFKGI
jgi:large subunit ribosomal protein L23